MAKTLRLGAKLRYPITISEFLKNHGEDVTKQQPILRYTFKYKRLIGDPSKNEEREIEETGVADWDSPAEGKIKQWQVKIGDVIRRDQDLVAIEETCGHEIQYAGLCAICGKDMKEATYASESLDTERATVAMVHDNIALTVSTNQATRAEMQLQRRLLKERKLSLVVDLDQTIIHACIDPTVGEWQRDPSNPNYEAVKDVCSFQLDDGPRGATSGCWYYIKMRPGLAEFLEKVSQLFELHVYTMGTRAYALNIAKIVDPTQKLFGNRIISRDENDSIVAKSLQRLFPVSTNMVVVIDDRADVWPRNRPNLIKVTPYDFFTGIGDINSSFLPKREDLVPAPMPPPEPKAVNGNAAPQPTSDADTSSNTDQAKPLANGNDENALLQLQAEEQERTLEKQLKDRPLLHLQEELDREDEEAEKKSTENGDSPEPSMNGESESPSHQRHKLLRDDDRELRYLEQHLTTLHHSFYAQYDARSAHLHANDIVPDIIPDVGSTLNFLKSQILRDTRLVLSGLVPLDIDVRRTEIGMQAESFGAEIRTRVSREITHLVINIARPRTQKVRQAARIPSIKIVNQNWLADSIAQWKKMDEDQYLVQIHPADRNAETPLEGSASPPRPKRITIYTSGQQFFEDDQDEEDDDGDADGSGDEEEEDDDDEDDELEDRFNVMPPELMDGEHSPIEDLGGMEWGDVDKELEEFMGSDIDDSDFESTQGTDHGTDTETDEPKSRKRKLGEDGDNDDDLGESATGSVLAKKQRIAKARTTGLRNVRNATDEEDAEGSGLPTPLGTGDEDANGVGDDDDDDFADLEAELEAELRAEGEAG
ncbi:uncharacterized protein GGS22DRAFT_77783 [Annulohypoxylon maeteangense]|uniref:uncharacterized protein n=1 Tax=Annulohypoxylon maeteangense TaxID=1927788 RepID=UPI00200877B5|nr:uncharacterized protein GGS22DRAFT_77783 [Annulohypoxylon maeteangense]KAI0880889.1 hypothetical protein GGS22DRAFT_77783 [Annulohypoxylon maeteangense]